MGIDLNAGEVGALEAATEGWIAALQLAALSMPGRDDIDDFIATFTGDDRFVVTTSSRRSSNARATMSATSCWTRPSSHVSKDRFDAVTGGSGGRSTLERLERANLFVVALDDRRSWYRYHHLFADVLRATLVDEAPERVGALHRRASDWYDAHGEPTEAISHAIAGKHFERAAELVKRATAMLTRTRQELALRH